MNQRQSRSGATRSIAVLLLLALAALVAGPARAAPVKMVYNGSPSNRIDVVILGDGYLSTEMTKFATDAQNFIDKFFAYTPFKEYARSFNVWRLDTPSQTSGASHNGRPGKTRYGAYFNCMGIERLICLNDSKVQAVLAAQFAAAQQDMVLILVNDPEYGGSGGQFAIASTNPSSSEVAMHEYGHSFGHLDDEYVDPSLCDGGYPPWGFNVTQETTRATIPWTKWIAKTTPIPTPSGEKVGLFQGAYYCADGWYRPTMNSIMRSIEYPFREVNGEQILRRVYETISPADSTSPASGNVTIAPGRHQSFKVKLSNPYLTSWTFAWRLGGTVISTTDQAVVKASDLSAGPKTLQLSVRDATKMVRNDPSNLLIERVVWRLRRGP